MSYIKRTKKRLSQAKIKKRRYQLRKLNKLFSWRIIHADYYPEVSYQTLQAFAEGRRVPASDKACAALDLYADANPYRGLPRWFNRIPASLDYVNKKKAQISGMQADAKRQRFFYK